MTIKLRLLTLSCALIGALWAGLTHAADGCCAHCGRKHECQKVCRLVCEEKQIDVCCYGCKCEEFCLPCHSKQGCKHCETVCENCEPCGSDEPHAEPKRFVWFDWFPTSGAKTYTRTKLMRKTDKVTVPTYKWVVEDVCPECTAKVEAHNAATAARIAAANDATSVR